ncbi:MAG: formate dehydrogenase accessory sulfurtransferase FdhD [Roseiflexus sp.]|nr:formate dehydrogenase accessory sulfurtransferase FdhD [Roseiflexus sp.]MCS7288193.1 formate dehydrogenase accessory sulfurtransferase FdhD [Roseiflexus sp.]MDW8234515.1 formate dehydrogenase accessory sulfurtransferase FdhD [Roseiflexaceae bacterium]
MLTRPNVQRRTVIRVRDGQLTRDRDALVVEEPLEIRLALPTANGAHIIPLTTILRTPGEDFELAAGFLFNEGIVHERNDIATIRSCADPDIDEEARFNTITVDLRPGAQPDLSHARRLFYISSSCGVCGKASLEALRTRGCAPLPDDDGVRISFPVLTSIDAALRRAQALFQKTGGLHAAALFAANGDLLALHEDIGRHNAVDKLIGAHLLQGRLGALSQAILLVSGRAGFEILQKALTARIPVVAAIGAPSTLAVALAQQFNMTLIGFLRGASFNVYAGEWRIEEVQESGKGSLQR